MRANIHKLLLKAKKLIYTDTAGNHPLPLKNDGLDFKELREYTPDCDARYIDWKISAKFQKPYMRQYQNDSSLRPNFILAYDKTLEFADKKEILLEALLLLAYSAIKHEDPISIRCFDGEEIFHIPHTLEEEAIVRLASFLDSYRASHYRTDFDKLFDQLHYQHPSLIIIMGDLLAQIDFSRLDPKHDYIFISINAPLELDLSPLYNYTILDLDHHIVSESLQRAQIQHYNKTVATLLSQVQEASKRLGARFIQLLDKNRIYTDLYKGLSSV